MDYTIQCVCGEQLRVATTDAGGSKRCFCGAVNAVPSLGELRRLAGKQKYEVRIADKLRSMLADGALPPSQACARCGCETDHVLDCTVECERPYAKSHSLWFTVLLGLFGSAWMYRAVERDYLNPEVYGEELIVSTPLPLCPRCSEVRLTNKSLRDLLRRVPLYAQLLDEYPKASADVVHHPR